MKIHVGSTNPVKVQAVRKAFSQFFPSVSVHGLSVDSGVSDMPLTEEETRQGALNRTRACLDGADFSVGLEGGVMDTEDGMYLIGHVAITDSKGRQSSCASNGFMLPQQIARKLREGEELGPLLDKLLGTEDIKKKQGAIGHFTKGHITRSEAFEHAVIYALVPFINEEMYNGRI